MFLRLRLFAQFATMAERPSNFNLHRYNILTPVTLTTVWDNPGSRRFAKRLGRGNNGKGNSSTKGQRGQNSRSGGGVHPKFEGGQTPISRRLPKWGAKPRQDNPREVNIHQIIDRVLQGRIDGTQVVTIKHLWDAGLFKQAKFGVKLLARGAERLSELPQPLKIEVTDASKTVIDAIKNSGGNIECVYRTPLLMREHLHPEKFPLVLRNPLPSSKTVHRLQRIEAKGVEVSFKKPNWLLAEQQQLLNSEEIKKAELPKEEVIQKEKKDKKKKKAVQSDAPVVDISDFQYPAVRTPGSGAKKIRRRKPEIYKTIDLKLE